jgi:hypothetical protein
MHRTFAFIFILMSTAACHKQVVEHKQKIDACSLITDDEVRKIENAPVTSTKASENSSDGLRIAQCFYTTDPFNKSVSLAVTQADSASSTPRNAKQNWHDIFGKFEGEAKQEEGDEEKKKSLGGGEEEEAKAPKKIEGVGESAYWSSNRVGGALYVLKGDVFIRISVGGSDSEEAKLEKCKSLARKALSRL